MMYQRTKENFYLCDIDGYGQEFVDRFSAVLDANPDCYAFVTGSDIFFALKAAMDLHPSPFNQKGAFYFQGRYELIKSGMYGDFYDRVIYVHPLLKDLDTILPLTESEVAKIYLHQRNGEWLDFFRTFKSLKSPGFIDRVREYTMNEALA